MPCHQLWLRLPSELSRLSLKPSHARTFQTTATRTKANANIFRQIDVRVQYPSELKAEEKKEETILPGKKELVVILLGWAGAQHKHLAKYSEFYLKRGAITVSYVTQLRSDYVTGTRKYPFCAKSVLKEFKSRGFTDHPVFFHIFSNGGASTYSYVLREMTNSKKYSFEIKGTIFDSAPAPRELKSLIDAGLEIYSHLSIFRYPVVGLAATILVFQIYWFHLKAATILCTRGESLDFLEFPETNPIPLSNWLEVIANYGNNYLFLFSYKDKLIPGEEVERFSKICERRGSRVKRVIFQDSEHVKHFRKYPEKYGNAVIDFIRTTMAEDDLAKKK